MTREEREEAIKVIKNFPVESTGERKAVMLAIKALEQDPGEELISCEAVIEWLKAKDIIKLSSQEKVARKELKALPSGNPTKTGHWMPIEYPTGVEAFGVKEMSAQELQCSECGKTVDISDGDFKYCPYCKVKMVEPQESEDKE